MAQTGILTPFRRDGKADWANGSGPALTRTEIAEALGIKRSELAWDTTRGCRLHLLRHKTAPLEVLRDLAELYVREALAAEVPSAVVRQVQIARTAGTGGQETTLAITVWYDLIDTSSGAILARDQTLTSLV
jgi:hypothetical protein